MFLRTFGKENNPRTKVFGSQPISISNHAAMRARLFTTKQIESIKAISQLQLIELDT